MKEIRPKVFGTNSCLLAFVSREKTAAMLGVPILWLSTATAAAIKTKMRMRNWELETTPLSKVRHTSLPPSVSEKFSLRTRCMSRCAFASPLFEMGKGQVSMVSNRPEQSATHEMRQFEKERFNVVPTVFFAASV